MTNSSLQCSEGNSQSDVEQVINTELFKGRDIIRSDTPDTWLPDCAIKPDITFQCEVCKEYFSIQNISNHRSYHKALITLNYSHFQVPKDVKSLSQRRSNILKRLQADSPKKNFFHPADMKIIDAAYEIVKNHIEDADEDSHCSDQTVDTSLHSAAFDCSLNCVSAVGLCSSPNRHWKQNMEDAHTYQDYFGEDKSKCYLAIFDGYHGTVAARRSSQELHGFLLKEMVKFDSKIKSTVARNFVESGTTRTHYEQQRPDTRESIKVNLHQESTDIIEHLMNVCSENYNKMMDDKSGVVQRTKNHQARHHTTEQIHNAFRKSYLLMDIHLSHGQDETSKVRWSGTSAVTVLIQDVKPNIKDDLVIDKESFTSETYPVGTTKGFKSQEVIALVHIANAGNCRALLIQGGLPYCLTNDHTGKNMKERKRVLAAGGNFSSSDRDSLVCGLLTVTRGLGNHGDKKLKDCVIVDPYVTSVPIHQHAQFLILASGGLWEVLSDEEVTGLLVKMLPDQQIPPPREISESLLPLLYRQQGPSSTHITSGPQLSKQHDQTNTHAGSEQMSEEQYCHSNMGNASYERVISEPNLIFQKDQMEIQIPNLSEGPDLDLNIRRQDCTEESNMASAGPDTADSSNTEKAGKRELSRAMAEHLTQAAILAGAKNNITVMVVLLPACGMEDKVTS